jgi:ubiquitin-activating enzyme E1
MSQTDNTIKNINTDTNANEATNLDDNTIDDALYDRQIRTFGKAAVKMMSKSSVLIVGLANGLATEVGKNLALGGIRNIYLFDTGMVTHSDLDTGFYYTTESIGQSRSKVLVSKLQELNPYVTVESVESYKQKQNVTIVINQSIETVQHISDYCRNVGSKLVVLYSKGVSGAVFVDAGSSHVVSDATGETIDPVQIGEITPEGKVRCATHSSHDFQSGDYIKFENLEGKNVEQFQKEWKIKVINNTTFELESCASSNKESCKVASCDKYTPFSFMNGTAVHVKKPVTVSHKTWSEQMNQPTLAFNFDMEKAEKLVKTYQQMYSNNLVDSMPFIWSEKNKYWMESNNIALADHARTFAYELIPVVSLMGSIAASEAIKLVTNKYLPINQWFTWFDNTLLPSKEPDFAGARSAYGFLWGTKFENKLVNSRWFMVGSGAIGCEHLKNLAYMNVANQAFGSDSGSGTGTGEVILTDPDQIEKSNLNRQFLFRSQHIGKPKSETAASVIRNMKPEMKITAHLQKVGNDNLDWTSTQMEANLTGVLNALDNIKARRFMDEMCFKYGLPLFESGTTGTKGNTQPVIPFVTETYSNSADPEQEKSFPICTIKSFPNEIAHTIHWAMDQFEFFNRAPATMNKWIKMPSSIEELSQVERGQAIEDINKFSFKYPTQLTGIKGCAEWAVDMFVENYTNSINQLLHTFKPDHELAPGVLFWSAGKRCPKPITWDPNNQTYMDYVEASTHLFARVSGLEDNFTREELYDMIKDYKPVEFVPKEMAIATNDSEIEKTNKTVSLSEDLPVGSNTNFKPTYVSQDFEKDDDSNWHISWVNAASNIRAMNYGIPVVDRQQTKGIAGRIIPAIATTTSAVSGLILLEMLKYLQGMDKVDMYRSTFINLAEPVLVYSDPIDAPMMEIAGVKVNSWTKFEYTKDSTLGEFKKYYEKMFNVSINMIVIGTAMVYAEFLGGNNLDKKLSDVIFNTLDSVPSNVSFSLGVDDDTKEVPTINVNLKKTPNNSVELSG